MTSGVGSSPDVVAMEPRNSGGSVSVGLADGGGGIVNPAFQPPSLLSQQSTVWTRRQQAVCVRHAFKHYGSASKPNHVLSNLNMTVAKGTMSVYKRYRISNINCMCLNCLSERIDTSHLLTPYQPLGWTYSIISEHFFFRPKIRVFCRISQP